MVMEISEKMQEFVEVFRGIHGLLGLRNVENFNVLQRSH